MGENPDGYIYDPATKRGFTLSNRTKSAVAVDLVEAKVAGTVPLGSKPAVKASSGQVTATVTDNREIQFGMKLIF